jgi:hypothetical protein
MVEVENRGLVQSTESGKEEKAGEGAWLRGTIRGVLNKGGVEAGGEMTMRMIPKGSLGRKPRFSPEI